MKLWYEECPGCCGIKRAGEWLFTCVFIQCLFHPGHNGHGDKPENRNGFIASNSFT